MNSILGRVRLGGGSFGACAAALRLAVPPRRRRAYPSRQITLVVPFAPGGPADFLGRLIGQKMSEDLGQQIVVDNRPGANTIIGAQAVAKASPDGYTLLMAIDGTLVMNPFLYSKLAYDPFKDFVPISLIALVPSALVGNINIPVNSIKELVEQEKAKPGTFQIGISTPTSQVNVGLLNMMAGTNFTMVPYRGGTTQITGILAGDIPLGMESINVSLPLWRDKKLKILGLVSAQRLSLAPEIPTIAETFPGYDLGIWQSIVAPAGTPRDVVTKLHGSLSEGAGDDRRARKAAQCRHRARDQQEPGGVRRLHPLAGGHARQGHQGGRTEAGLAAMPHRGLASSPSCSPSR